MYLCCLKNKVSPPTERIKHNKHRCTFAVKVMHEHTTCKQSNWSLLHNQTWIFQSKLLGLLTVQMLSNSQPLRITPSFRRLPLCPCFLTTDLLIIPPSLLAFFMPSTVNDLTYAQPCPGAGKRKRGKCKFHYICAGLQASNYTPATADFTLSLGRPGWMTAALHLLSEKAFIVESPQLVSLSLKVYFKGLYCQASTSHFSVIAEEGAEKVKLRCCLREESERSLCSSTRSTWGLTSQEGTSVQICPTGQLLTDCAVLKSAES